MVGIQLNAIPAGVSVGTSVGASVGEAAWYRRQFNAFREMYKARDFELVLEASGVSEDSVRELERAVAAEMVWGGLPPELSVAYTLRATRGSWSDISGVCSI